MSAKVRTTAVVLLAIATVTPLASADAAPPDQGKQGKPAAAPPAHPAPPPAARPAPPPAARPAPPPMARPAPPPMARPAAPAIVHRPPPPVARPPAPAIVHRPPPAARPAAPAIVHRAAPPSVARPPAAPPASAARPAPAPPSAAIRRVDRPAFRGRTQAATPTPPPAASAPAAASAPPSAAVISRRDLAAQRTQNWRNRRAAARVIQRAAREDARAARKLQAITPGAGTPGANAISRRELAVQRTQNWRNRRAAARVIARAEREDARVARAATRTGIATAFGTLPPARGARPDVRTMRNRHRAGVGAAAAIGAAFAARQAVHGNWYRDWRRHRIAHGWFGPVYWPYAYDTIFVDVFWRYYAPYYVDYDPFWDYGYSDIYSGLFSPYAYEEFLAPPPGGRYATAPARSRVDTTGAIREVTPACGDDSRDLAGVPVDDIAAAVEPNDAQRAALDELGNASVKAAQIVKAACPGSIALTPVGRLDAMAQRVDGMLQAVAAVRAPMEKFYGLLSDEQKARFNALGARQDSQSDPRSLARSCAAASQATDWPSAQIRRAVRPTAAQAESLDAVRRAAERSADILKASCPSEMPATPPARLAAIETRLTAMREAIETVRSALAAFYDGLSDEQKAQFNAIGRARTSRAG